PYPAQQPYPGDAITTGSIGGGVRQSVLPPVPSASAPQPYRAAAPAASQPYPAMQTPIYDTPRPVAAAPAAAPQGWSTTNGSWVTLM
ncbi:hypothetical protein J8J27_30030, partial [Mycobacterium tuberculosis]|nr:hypothetical protein [Mycobacterium tuberculosis]